MKEVPSIRQANDKLANREENVRKQYPNGDKPAIKNIMSINANKEDLGEPSKMKNVEQRRTKGFITHEDVIRLSKLQNDLFPDYDYLKRCLNA